MSFNGRDLSVGMRGSDVSLLHKILKYLGYSVSDDDIQTSNFGESTRKIVIQFQSDYHLNVTETVDNPTTDKLLELAKGKNYPMVSGMILTSQGVAAKGLKVVAIDKTLEEGFQLGETITDVSGNYAILYEKQGLNQRGKLYPDIEIKVINPQDDSRVYGISSTHFKADNDSKINLILSKDSIDQASEYNRIVSDLLLCIGNKALKDLLENEQQQDISYLANKTGWDARLVAMASLADKYGSESGILPSLYYSLFRAGLSADLDKLYRSSSDTVKRVWEEAIKGNIIDGSMNHAIDQNLLMFKEAGRTHLLEKAKPVGVSSFKELLSIVIQDISMQQEFVELYFNHVGEMSIFWEKIESKFGKDLAAKLQLVGKLSYLTLNNAKLIAKLNTGNLVQKDPSDLVINHLYKKESWYPMISNEVPVPEDIAGETKDEKKKNYINYIVFLLKTSYPTLVIAEMVNDNELQVKGDSNVKSEVYNFLYNMHDKFRIGTQPLDKVLKDNNIKIGEKALNQLKRLQRVYQISPSDETMKVLWDNNLDSAFTIVQYGKEEFVTRFGKDLGGEDIASLIYSKAHLVNSTILNTAISYMTYRAKPEIYAISGKVNQQ